MYFIWSRVIMIAPSIRTGGMSVGAFYDLIYRPLKSLRWKPATASQYEIAVRQGSFWL